MPLVVSCAALVAAIAAIGGSDSSVPMEIACALVCLLLGMALGESVRCRAEAKAIRECAEDGKGKICNSDVCKNTRVCLVVVVLVALVFFLIGLISGTARRDTCVIAPEVISVALFAVGFLLGICCSTRGL